MRDDERVHTVWTMDQLLYRNDPDIALPACATPLRPVFSYVTKESLVALLAGSIPLVRATEPLPDAPPELLAERARCVEQLRLLLDWVRQHPGTKVWIGWFPAPEYPEQERPHDRMLELAMAWEAEGGTVGLDLRE